MDKVLVVDSDPEILKKTADGFKDLHHFELLTATSIQSAIAIFQKERVSVLVSAVRFPGRDVLDLLTYMTRKFPSIPCIVMLNPDDPKPWFTEPDGHVGLLYYVRKPFAFGDLASSIFVGLNLRDEGLTLKGIFLRNFLPLIAIARKTCRLEIRYNSEKTGFLYFAEGQLLDARANGLIGEAAVREIAGWRGFQITVSDLPADRKQKQIDADMMAIINATWQKAPGPAASKHLRAKKTDHPHNARPQKAVPIPDVDKKPAVPASAPQGRSKLELALSKHSGFLRTVKGYRGLAVLSNEGKVLAADTVGESPDFETIAEAFTLIHADCSKHLSQRGLGPCSGFSFHTPAGIIIMRTTDVYAGGNFRFLAVMSEEGNSFFLQVQLKTLIPKILSEISKTG